MSLRSFTYVVQGIEICTPSRTHSKVISALSERASAMSLQGFNVSAVLTFKDGDVLGATCNYDMHQDRERHYDIVGFTLVAPSHKWAHSRANDFVETIATVPPLSDTHALTRGHVHRRELKAEAVLKVALLAAAIVLILSVAFGLLGAGSHDGVPTGCEHLVSDEQAELCSEPGIDNSYPK